MVMRYCNKIATCTWEVISIRLQVKHENDASGIQIAACHIESYVAFHHVFQHVFHKFFKTDTHAHYQAAICL